MIRRVTATLAVAGLSCLLVVSADLPDKWRAWRFSREVSPNTAQSNGPAQIRLPWEVFTHCAAGCGDLRVIDRQGQEVPYEMTTNKAVSHSESYGAQIVENSFISGKYTQVVGDLGRQAPFYDRVRVETGESDFIVWAEVALSDDAKTWRVVEARAPIARFRKRSVDGTQTIPFQGLNSRYIRIRIFAAEQKFGITGLTVLHEEAHPAELAEVPASFEIAQAEDTTESIWTTNLASSHIPVSQLRFSTDSEEFYRAVRISASDDGKVWSYRTSGIIYRYKAGEKNRESLAVDFYEWPVNEHLRIQVINGNDRALNNVKLSLSAVPRRIVFKYQAGQNYRLVYGNEQTAAPQYDLGHFLEGGSAKPMYLVLTVGVEERTVNYKDPRPFTERHPEVLWISLAVAILLIGLTALKTLRTANGTSSSNQA
jgi:hypothetical protein